MLITNFLPTKRDLYIHLVSGYNNTWIFKFQPPSKLFEKIFLYNDLIFGEFVPEKYVSKLNINYKSKTL